MEVTELIKFFRDTKDLRPPAPDELKKENYQTGLYAWYSDRSLVQKAGIEIPSGPWHINDIILLYVGKADRKSYMRARLRFHACRGRADQSPGICKRLGCLLAAALEIELHQVLGQATQLFWSPRTTLITWVQQHLYFKARPCDCPEDVEPDIISTLRPLLNRDHKPPIDFDKRMASLEKFHTDLARRNPRPFERLRRRPKTQP